MFHASAVINFHREGLIAFPTLRSLDASRQAAREVGFEIEFIAVLDRADAETTRVVQQWRHCFEQIHYVEFGDLGASRAFGIEAARANWVFMHDADDLFSTNWHSAFLSMLAEGKADFVCLTLD